MPSHPARPTIYDVAARAGTSVSTVSRVVNGSALVQQSTVEAVQGAIADLGFVARRIRRQATRSVLNIVVFLPRGPEPHSSLFYDVASLFAGIQRGLGEVRAHTIAVLAGETSPFEGKKLGDIDGCIFAFVDPPPEVEALLAERAIPAVVINRLADRLASVANDAAAGMGALASHILRERPEARPLFLSVEPAGPVAEYRWQALMNTPLAIAENDRRNFESISVIEPEDVRSMVADGYDTLICVNDLVASALLERLALLGVSVPAQVGVSGYDNAPVRGLLSRDLTSVDLAVEQQGETAARMLSEAIIERSLPTGTALVAGAFIPGETI